MSRRAGVGAMTAALVLVWLAALPARAATAPDPTPPPRPTVLVFVTGLTWANAVPLDGYAKANLSMRSFNPDSGSADTFLSFGKGAASSQARLPGGVGSVASTADGGARLIDWNALERHDSRLHVSGNLGAVGTALAAAGRTWALASDDPAAVAAAADGQGGVPHAVGGSPSAITAALATRPDALIVAVPRPELASVLGIVDVSADCVVVASSSTPARNSHLGVFATSSSCGLGAGGFYSTSTHHRDLATIPDLSRTFLRLTATPAPAGFGGGAISSTSPVTTGALAAQDHKVRVTDLARGTLLWLFVGLEAVGALLAIAVPRLRLAVCCALLAVPAASFLVMLVPWWRSGPWAAIGAGGAIAAVIGLAGVLLARRDRLVGIGALAGATAALIAIDALFGSPLQIDAPFGNSPASGGRFYGDGNIGSGFLVAGLVVAVAMAYERWGRRTLPWSLGALGAATIAAGAPQFGADAGGVLYAVPSFGVVLFAYRRLGRVRLRDVFVLAGVAVATVAAVIGLDLIRHSSAQTHLARSVGSSGLADEVLRKGQRALESLGAPLTLVVVIGAVALAKARLSFAGRPALRFAAAALLVAAVLGSAVNDSGLNVAAAVTAIGWPALLAAAGAGKPGP